MLLLRFNLVVFIKVLISFSELTLCEVEPPSSSASTRSFYIGHDDASINSNSRMEGLFEGFLGFKYYGGRLLVDPITVYLIWLGSWEETSKEALRNAIRSLSQESGNGLPDLFNWWKVATQYTDRHGRPISGNVTLGSGECHISQTSTLNREMIDSLLLQAFNGSSSPSQAPPLLCSSILPQDDTAVYHIVLSDDVSISKDLATFRCSDRFVPFKLDGSGPDLTLAWSRKPQEREYCNVWSYGSSLSPPNARDNGGLDSVISFVLAQTVSAATNTDFQGYASPTVSDACPFLTGSPTSNTPVVDDDTRSWNLVGIKGHRYLVQQIWSEEAGACQLQPYDYCTGLREMKSFTGIVNQGVIVNHNVGLQSYKRGLHCQWHVEIPHAVIIRFTINYLSLGRSEDYINLYSCNTVKPSCLQKVYTGLGSPHQLVLQTSEFLFDFKSSRNFVPDGMGWEVEYKAGFCSGTQRITTARGTLSDGSPENATYLEKHVCAWFLEGIEVELSFGRFDTIHNQDTLVVYRGNTSDLQSILKVYSGNFSTLPRETFPGPVLLEFRTNTGKGQGWALEYSMRPLVSKRVSSSRDFSFVIAAVCGNIGGMAVAVLLVASCMRKALRVDYEREITQPLLLRKKIKAFSSAVLRDATNEFSASNLISQGTNACVYRATLSDGQKVVVKKTKLAAQELAIFSSISHSNIVNFKGYCFDGADDAFLVLDHIPNASLAHHLFSGDAARLSWTSRLRIAVQVSSALEYLHAFVEPSIIHGNVSSDNVLLDECWNAKLAGFGNSVRICARRVGARNFELKAEDVHRFGGVVMELVTEERSRRLSGEFGERTTWDFDAIESGKGDLVVDEDVDKKAVFKMAQVGCWCLNENAREKPTMVEVASALRQILSIATRRKS